MDLRSLCRSLDEYLNVAEFTDVAVNGLQVEGCSEVSRVALSVDASLDAIEGARQQGAQLLLCHHGLLWGGASPLTGVLGARLGRLFTAGISLYASHLPLDAHPQVGNNAELARLLGLRDTKPFGRYRGRLLGQAGSLPEPTRAGDLVAALESSVGPCLGTVGAGARIVSRVAVVSGAAGDMSDEAVAAGVDLLVTGELEHVSAMSAHDAGLDLVFLGHHATEVFGVRALAAWIEAEFGLESVEVGISSGF